MPTPVLPVSQKPTHTSRVPRQYGTVTLTKDEDASGTQVHEVQASDAEPAWAKRVADTGSEKYDMVIMNQSSIGAPNTSAIMLQLELENRGHNVATVHWEHGNTHLDDRAGKTYLISDGCRVKLSGMHGVSDDENFMAMIHARMAKPGKTKNCIRIEEREGELYAVYPPVIKDIAEIQGINTMSDRPEKYPQLRLMEEALKIQERIEKEGNYGHRATPLTSVENTRVTMDKVRTQECFAAAEVPTPDSFCLPQGTVFNEAFVRSEIEKITPPYMVKGGLGSGASDVFPIDGKEEAIAKVAEILATRNSVVVQERIEPLEKYNGIAHVKTYLVLNGKIIQATRWEGSSPEERTVPMVGGSFTEARAIPFTPTTQEEGIVISTVAACGQAKGLASVDAIEKANGETVILEANSMPGLASAQRAGDVPVVARVAEEYTAMIAAHQVEVDRVIGRSPA